MEIQFSNEGGIEGARINDCALLAFFSAHCFVKKRRSLCFVIDSFAGKVAYCLAGAQ